MSKLKVGDRVAVYGYTSDSELYVNQKGTVAFVDSIPVADVHLDAGGIVSVHARQCRRLVPKAKPVVRWYVIDRNDNLYLCDDEKDAIEFKNQCDTKADVDGPHRVVLMREVRLKKASKL